MVAGLRLALGSIAGLSLAACSLITSFDGLEASDASDASGGNDAGSVGARAEGGSEGGGGAIDGTPADDGTAPTDATAPPSDTTAPPSDATTATDATDATDATAPPSDAGGGCAADVSTDPNNCGACGHDCQGGACTSGACGPVTLAITHGSIGVAIDSTFVYWADVEAGAIEKISKALTHTGTPSPVASGAVAQSVQGVASDGTYVYWTNKTASGQVHRALPTGANLTTIATNQAQPDWIASNGVTVAWTDQASNQVMIAPANSDGGVAPTQLNDAGEVGTAPAGVAIDDAKVYYAAKTAGGGFAESVPVAGGPVSQLGTGTYVGIAVDSTFVYWTGGFSNPSVYQNTKTGTAATEKTLVAGNLICPLAVASDGANVYFLDQGTSACTGTSDAGALGALYRVPVGNSGTLPPPLVAGLNDPMGIALDTTAVYWVTGGPTGAVTKLAK